MAGVRPADDGPAGGVLRGGVPPGGWPPIRPLIIAVRPEPGESVAGLVARSTRANVLGTTQIILREVGLSLAHPGTVGQELGDRAGRLAAKIGCEAHEIEDRAHGYVGRDEGGPLARWGSGTLRRSDLILDRRLISPSTLAVRPFHMAAWQCRHLPYCPESLEALVDTCPRCDATLRWSKAWGVAKCDSCRTTVEHVHRDDDDHDVLELGSDVDSDNHGHNGGRREHSATINAAFAHNYRRFADLLSIEPTRRAAERATLAPALAALSQPVLVDLILACGHALSATPRRTGRKAIRALKAQDRAAAISAGMDFIEEWPSRLRQAVSLAFTNCQANPSAQSSLLAAVRSLGDARAFGAEQAIAVKAAVPEAFEQKRRALAGLVEPIALMRDLCNGAGISSGEARRLVDANIVSPITASTGARRQVQLRRTDLDAVVVARRNSVPCTRLEQRLGLPRYAVEQLVELGAVSRERHPAVILLDSVPRITRGSVDCLLQALEARAQQVGGDRGDTVGDRPSLWAAMRTMGGGLKPWGAVLAAILNGALACASIPALAGRPFVRRVTVDADDIRRRFGGPWRRSGTPEALMSQADACEVLNLDNLQIRDVVTAGDLVFEKSGNALTVRTADVEELAQRLVAASEVSAALCIRADAVAARLRKDGSVRAEPGGWCRTNFEEFIRRTPEPRSIDFPSDT